MKRMLSFDGGGVRGVFALQIAARIEQHLREVYDRCDLVLADVVDLFAGTSTGAIIDACLAWGTPVDEVERLYLVLRYLEQMAKVSPAKAGWLLESAGKIRNGLMPGWYQRALGAGTARSLR